MKFPFFFLLFERKYSLVDKNYRYVFETLSYFKCIMSHDKPMNLCWRSLSTLYFNKCLLFKMKRVIIIISFFMHDCNTLNTQFVSLHWWTLSLFLFWNGLCLIKCFHWSFHCCVSVRIRLQNAQKFNGNWR